jgi:brefeldin A-resistance guanine nucleotide exchange factor 1
MRELLETFRLPGEAQPIARITETFAAHFFSFAPRECWTSPRQVTVSLTGHSGDCEPGRRLRLGLLGYHVEYGSSQSAEPSERLRILKPTCQG